jgi:hypothetical protein
MWSEEELRDIPSEALAPRTGARSLASGLRRTLAGNNLARASGHAHELTRGHTPSVIYAPDGEVHGNFIAASYRRIVAHPGWSRRLEKAHTAKRQARPTGPDEETRAWRELDTATSSDALLMNIFCYPRALYGARLTALLGISAGLEPIFGYRPCTPRHRDLSDRTEIDMRLGHLLVEAKLTESDFQTAPLRLLERYTDFDNVFDRADLPRARNGVGSYQLVRGILAAYVEQATFCVFLDARRPDLIEAWYATLRAVRSYTLQSRLRLLTWQELAPTLPRPLQLFLDEKYGI